MGGCALGGWLVGRGAEISIRLTEGTWIVKEKKKVFV